MKIMKLKIKTFAAILAALLIGTACSATPTILDLNHSGFLGYVTPGVAADPVSETTYVQGLVDLAPGTTGTVYSEAGQLNALFRYTTVTLTNLPEPVEFVTKYNVGENGFTSTSTFSITGVDYVLAKYGKYGNLGQVSLVWWVTGIGGDAQIATSKGLSHVTLFDPVRTNVPDSGSTIVMLLGSAMMGLVAFRKFV